MAPGERKQYRDHLEEIRLQQDALDDSFEEGIAAGKKEAARNLLKLGLDHKLISQATGLTEDEIGNLEH